METYVSNRCLADLISSRLKAALGLKKTVNLDSTDNTVSYR